MRGPFEVIGDIGFVIGVLESMKLMDKYHTNDVIIEDAINRLNKISELAINGLSDQFLSILK